MVKFVNNPIQGKIAYAQMTMYHPVLRENDRVRAQNYNALYLGCNVLIRLSQYGKAVLNYYSAVMKSGTAGISRDKLNVKLRVVMLFDVIHISGYRLKSVSPKLVKYFNFPDGLKEVLVRLTLRLTPNNPAWNELLKLDFIKSESDWINMFRENLGFSLRHPYTILITSTMSAGKSTFVNALVGSTIAKTRNLACTGRPHFIYSKPFDDGLISKWDRTVKLDAGGKILDNREETKTRISYESAYFSNGLSGKRCMILDTPGVNSSEYQAHGSCTRSALTSCAYDAVIFLVNYENSGTDDESAHLQFVWESINENVPIIFAVNKVDSFKSGDQPLNEKLTDIRQYLEGCGFKDPTVFFLSSQAAYLYRTRKALIDENDISDLEYLTKKFSRVIKLKKVNGECKNCADDFEHLCGIGYIEDYINDKYS